MTTWYDRICECGDVARVCYKPKGHEKCRVCASRETAYASIHSRWSEGREKVRYYYFCPTCPSVRVLIDKRKSSYCGVCSRKFSKQEPDKITYCLKEMKLKIPKPRKRYFAICPDCPPETATREVSQSANSKYGIHNRCRPCAVKAKPKSYNKTKPQVRKELKKPKVASPQAIKKAQEINREHRVAVQNISRVILVTQTKTEAQMIAEFLKTKSPSVVIDSKEPMPHILCGGLGTNSSAMGA